MNVGQTCLFRHAPESAQGAKRPEVSRILRPAEQHDAGDSVPTKACTALNGGKSVDLAHQSNGQAGALTAQRRRVLGSRGRLSQARAHNL